jgi:hypothetical protein
MSVKSIVSTGHQMPGGVVGVEPYTALGLEWKVGEDERDEAAE